MTAFPSGLTTGGVTCATPGVRATARSSAAPPVPGERPAAATISGASKPGPKPSAKIS